MRSEEILSSSGVAKRLFVCPFEAESASERVCRCQQKGSVSPAMEDLSPSFIKSFMSANRATQTNGYDLSGLEKIAAELAMDIVKYITGVKHQNAPNCYARTMRRCVEEMLVKHEILFNGMVQKLHITHGNVRLTFHNVVNELFRDGEINWGRVVSVYAFAARLAQHLRDQGCSDDVLPDIAEICGNFIAESLGGWIRSQGGWRSFEEYFPEQDKMEKSVWQGLLVTAALGLGALATMVAVR